MGLHATYRFRCRRGLSLTEILIVTVIVAIFTAMVFTQFRMGGSLWDIGNLNLRSQQSLRSSLDWIKNDLRQSGRGTITDVPADGNWYPQITFRKVAGVDNSQAVWDAEATRYSLDGQKRLVRQQGAQWTVIAEEIGSVIFRRSPNQPQSVEVKITSDKMWFKPGEKESISMVVKLRN